MRPFSALFATLGLFLAPDASACVNLSFEVATYFPTLPVWVGEDCSAGTVSEPPTGQDDDLTAGDATSGTLSSARSSSPPATDDDGKLGGTSTSAWELTLDPCVDLYEERVVEVTCSDFIDRCVTPTCGGPFESLCSASEPSALPFFDPSDWSIATLSIGYCDPNDPQL